MFCLLAAESSNPLSVDLLPILTSIVVFLLFFALLKVAVWPKIIKGLDDREQKILHEIESAEEAREKAAAAQAEYEQSLVEARQEAASMIAQAKADAKATADELIARNQSELTEMKQKAAQDIEHAKQAAIGALHAEAGMLATAVATKILQREVSVSDQQRLVDEALAELGQVQDS